MTHMIRPKNKFGWLNLQAGYIASLVRTSTFHFVRRGNSHSFCSKDRKRAIHNLVKSLICLFGANGEGTRSYPKHHCTT